jgi:hypothetical protein
MGRGQNVTIMLGFHLDGAKCRSYIQRLASTAKGAFIKTGWKFIGLFELTRHLLIFFLLFAGAAWCLADQGENPLRTLVVVNRPATAQEDRSGKKVIPTHYSALFQYRAPDARRQARFQLLLDKIKSLDLSESPFTIDISEDEEGNSTSDIVVTTPKGREVIPLAQLKKAFEAVPGRPKPIVPAAQNRFRMLRGAGNANAGAAPRRDPDLVAKELREAANEAPSPTPDLQANATESAELKRKVESLFANHETLERRFRLALGALADIETRFGNLDREATLRSEEERKKLSTFQEERDRVSQIADPPHSKVRAAPLDYWESARADVPPSFYPQRRFMVLHTQRLRHLEEILEAFVDYGNLFTKMFPSLEKGREAVTALNQSVAAKGIVFSLPQYSEAKQRFEPPKEFSPEIFNQILAAAESYRKSNAKENFFAGPKGGEYLRFLRRDPEDREQVINFDPDYYAESPIQLGLDGSLSPLAVSFGNCFQVFTEVSSHEWIKEGEASLASSALRFRSKADSRSEGLVWEMGIPIPGNSAPLYVTLSPDVKRSSDEGGSFGRNSFLCSGNEVDLDLYLTERKRVYQAFGRETRGSGREITQESSSGDPLSKLWTQAIGVGGKREPKPWRLRSSDPMSQDHRDHFHINGVVFEGRGPGRGLKLLKQETRVTDLAFSPNGEDLVSGSDSGEIRLIFLGDAGGDYFKTSRWSGHSGKVERVAFSSDGRQIFSVGAELRARLWNLNGPREPTMEFEVPSANLNDLQFSQGDTSAVAMLPGGRELKFDFPSHRVAGAKGGKRVSLESASPHHYRLPSLAIALSSDREGRISLWADHESGYRRTFRWKAHEGEIPLIRVFPGEGDSVWLASADQNGWLRIWRLNITRNANQLFLVEELENENGIPFTALASSPRAFTLAFGDRDGVIQLFPIPVGEKGALWKQE